MTDVSTQSDSGSRNSPPRKSNLFLTFAVIVIVLVIVGAFLMFQRRSQYEALAKDTESLAVPTVAIIHPSAEPGDENLVLPSTLQPYVESPIYARTNGYLKKWYRDIGSRVSKGELLADIDTPEVDQQLSQARADLATAQANVHLSDITAVRYGDLLKTDGVSKQEVDNAQGDLAAKRAIVQSSEANLRRLEELESFKHIYAPFAGVITRRNIDIGTLINAGNGGTTQLLFTLAQTDPIRVYVNVPETYAPAIHEGLGAYLELTQFPGQKFLGKVVRTAESIDQATRTLLTEVDVPNKVGQLLPGGYAQVHLQVNVKAERLQVPVNSLLFRSEGLRAVVIDSSHHVRLQPLTIGRDYGTTLEVLNGLKPDDWIVLNPPDSLEDGQQVHVKEVPNPTVPAPANQPGSPQPGQLPNPASPQQPPANSGKSR
jgi:RND family efflux transporter MFP subunit